MSNINTLSRDYSWCDPQFSYPVSTPVGPGLSGVIASASKVGRVDSNNGTIWYRGIKLSELVKQYSFEDVAYLLITGRTPSESEQYLDFRNSLYASRNIPEGVIRIVENLDPRIHPTRMLRTGVSAMGCFELSRTDDLAGTKNWKEYRFIGQLAGITELVSCHRMGRKYETSHSNSSIAEGLLTKIQERVPLDEDITLLNLLLVLYADHGLDAPTFTSMIVGSCHADPYYNIVAALSALRGPLLGQAGEIVVEQVCALKSAKEARNWVSSTVKSGERIAGFGHRMYDFPDPRAEILREEFGKCCDRHNKQVLYEIAQTVEREAELLLNPKGIYINVNFYGALIFHILGAEADLIPCLFMIGRMAGLVARVKEYVNGGRLFRPLSTYTGVPPRKIEMQEVR
ncbi:hypothetical protein K8I28_04460 [bacterium]|nr:hypothetical protein [bacterium]